MLKNLPEGIPTRWVICGCCEGNGQVDNPAFSNGITSDEWHHDWDEDERASYMRGEYDVPCADCKGSGKVRAPAVDRMTYSQKREVATLRREARIEAQVRSELAAEYASEARWGA